jgi:dipeptidyl aminopeptidase/acylaminoacyl peptidase
MYALTHPGCVAPAQIDENLPRPEEHQLVTDDGFRIRAWYYPSRNSAAIIALGGLQGALGDRPPPVAFLVKQGYGVLQIDSRACASPPAVVTLGYAEVNEAAAGLDFLLGQPEVDPERIGVMGYSLGGVSGIRAAARQPRFSAVVAEGGYFNLGRHIADSGGSDSIPARILAYSIAGAYWLQAGENPWRVSPMDDLAQVSPRPVLLIYGEGELANGDGKVQLAAAAEFVELWVVPGGDHARNYAVAREAYEKRVLSFYNRNLLDRQTPGVSGEDLQD